jgi:hypothetical protein
MSYQRAAFLATTAVALMALATAGFAEVIMTPDGHYYRVVPVREPSPGAASYVVTAIPEGATASVAPALDSTRRLTNFQNVEYQPQYVIVWGPE